MSKYKVVRVGDVCTLKSGKSIPKHLEVESGNIPYIKVSDMNIKENNKYIVTSNTFVGLDVNHNNIFPKGTVIFPKRGGAIGTNKKRLTSCEICADLNVMGVIPNDEILPEYLFAYFNTIDLGTLSNGSSVPQINNGDIAPIQIPLPDIDIQKKISILLDKSKELIDKRKEQIEALDELVKSRFMEMFGEWIYKKKNISPLSELCDFIDYRGRTPEKSENGIPLITAKNVKNNSFSFEPREYIPRENYNDVMTRGIPKVNDILFTTEAPLGNVCRIPRIEGIFCVGQRLITMQPLDNIVSEYLEYALLSEPFQREMWRNSSGSTVKGIRSKELVKLSIPVPPIEAQCQFADFVKQVDKLNSEMETSLKELEDNFNSLMQKAFKGELFN